MIAEMSRTEEPTRESQKFWLSTCCRVLPLGEVNIEQWNGYQIIDGFCSSCFTKTNFVSESDIWEWSIISDEQNS